MLRDWFADIATSIGAACVARAERLRTLSLRWNARARWMADVAEWFGTHKTWREIRKGRGRT